MTDGRGVVLDATLAGANGHDKWMVGETLGCVIVALAVSAPLTVAALGNPNETVKVFDAVQGA